MAETKERPARLLTLQGAADYLGVGIDLVRVAVNSGQIKTVVLGKRRMISTKVLDSFLEGQDQPEGKKQD
jgi:excisionase family DNA binding protein